MSLQGLVGKNVVAAFWNNGDIYLVFSNYSVDDKKIALLSPEGDCCANVYIETVSNPEALIDAQVFSIDDLEFTDEMMAQVELENSRGPVIDLWGHRINTTKGTCVLDCRTSHNGYYGGWLELSWVTEMPKNLAILTEK